MKLLIGIPSCHRYRYAASDEGCAHNSGDNPVRATIIRNTWYKLWEKQRDKIDLKFFYGNIPEGVEPRAAREDEVMLDVSDRYIDLPGKVQAMFKWALDNGYDYVLKCDDDVFIYPDRLLERFDPALDYTGFVSDRGPDNIYCCGAAYWLSKRAMEVIVAAPWTHGIVDSPNGCETDTAEDRWVGYQIRIAGLTATPNETFMACHCKICAKKYGASFTSFHCWPNIEIMHEFMKVS